VKRPNARSASGSYHRWASQFETHNALHFGSVQVRSSPRGQPRPRPTLPDSSASQTCRRPWQRHTHRDGGRLAKQRPRWVGHYAPDGKPAGLSPTIYRLLTTQRPTLPA